MTDTFVQDIFNTVIQFINEHKYDGACHDISAAFYLILKENNIEAELCIGEVKDGNYYFDHSWVEIDCKIYDIAISRPNVSSIAHPPVFASNCSITKEPPLVNYGAKSPAGFDDITHWISEVTLEEYSSGNPSRDNHLWSLTKYIASKANLDLDISVLRKKYGSTRRVIKYL